MISRTFTEEVAAWFPDLCGGGGTPDLETHADSIIVSALNFSQTLAVSAIAFYGFERVRAVAIERVNRLDNPAYRKWKATLELPVRDEMVERFQAMWRP